MTVPVLCEIADGQAVLTLNRPEKLNALNLAAFQEIDRHLDMIAARIEEIGCVLLRGVGRSFCAGHDLDDIAASGEAIGAQRFEAGVIERLAGLSVPVVAIVQGHCLTGGLELALAADLIIAAQSARFADTHSKWDLAPVCGLSQRLPRRVGRAKALEMMFSGRTYSGREAERMGLANLCAVDDELKATADALVEDILANARRANRAIKGLVVATDGMMLRVGLAYELDHYGGRGPDMAERLQRLRRR